MRDVLSDEYESVAGDTADPLIPGSMRRIGGALLFLGVIAAMGLWSYRLGTRDANEVPVIKAMAGPARVAPEEPGGLTAAHQGLEVNSVLAGREPQTSAGGAAATPEPVALADEDAAEGELVIAGKAMPDPADMPAGITSPNETAGETAATPEEAAPVSIQNEVAAMIAAVAPADGAPTEAAEAIPAETARPRGRPSNLTLARAAAPAPVAATATAATPAMAAAKPATREVSQPAAGARMVQLGAYDSEALARAAWNRMVARDGDLLGTKSLYVERATSNARVFYRLRVAGFDSADQTRRMCESLRGRGIDCIPVTLQ